MSKHLLSLSLIALFCLSLAACVGTRSRDAESRWTPEGRRWFDAELLSGYGPDGESAATLTVSIPRRSLVFLRQPDGRFRSAWKLKVMQQREGESLGLTSFRGEVVVENYEATRQGLSERRSYPITVPPGGPLEVVVELEVLDTRRRSREYLTLVPARLGEGGVALGELAIYRLEAGASAPAGSLLVLRPGLPPDPDQFEPTGGSSVFDLATGPPWLLLRAFDLAENPPPTRHVRVSVGGADADAEIRWSQDFELAREGIEAARLLKLPRHAFDPGDNRVVVELEGAGQRELILRDAGLDPTDDKSWSSMVHQLDGIANNREQGLLRDAPAADRLRLWEQFWERLDSDPSTPINERLAEHQLRIAHARRNFRDGLRDGAASDRGRVWVSYGRPDHVQEIGSVVDTFLSYEAWSYIEDGWMFYFRDVDGLGRYRLVHQERI